MVSHGHCEPTSHDGARRDPVQPANGAGQLAAAGRGRHRCVGFPDASFAADPADGPILKPLPEQYFTVYGTNAEMRWDSVDHDRYLTPQPGCSCATTPRPRGSTPRSYRLRSSATGWRARTQAEAVSLSLRDLRALPRDARSTAVHECTGNGRSFFATQQGTAGAGTQWKLGAVGAVTWEGVRLADVLRRLGIAPDAVDVMATGLDPTTSTRASTTAPYAVRCRSARRSTTPSWRGG